MNHREMARSRSALAVVGIAIAALGVSLLAQPLVSTLEEASEDIRMRWRLRLLPASLRADTRNLVLLAIDEKTENLFGRFGAGRWLSRQPFMDQLEFLQSFCRPSVLAYDIMLKEMAGAGAEGVTANPERLNALAQALNLVATDGGESLDDPMLQALSILVLEQANLSMAHMLAGIQERNAFPVVLGANLRGGWDAPQTVRIPFWSETLAADGGPPPVETLAYIAIPDEDVRFPSGVSRERYGYAPNGALPTREFQDYSLPGVLNIPRDADGVVRRAPLVMGVEDRPSGDGPARRFFVPTFALLSVLLHSGLDAFPIPPGTVHVDFGRRITLNLPDRVIRIPVDDVGRMRLNYRWRFDDFDALSMADTAGSGMAFPGSSHRSMAQPVVSAIWRRIAVVGVTTTGVDVGPTPVHPNIPLVYAQMTAINTILTGAFLSTLGPSGRALLLVVLSGLFVLLGLAIRSVRVTAALLLLLIGYGILAYGALYADWILLPVVQPTILMLSGAIGLLSFRYFTESREQRRIRGMFSTMVSERVLSWLEDHPESFSLEGHLTSATVLFSDIADFTRLSERLEPARLIRLLNLYLTPVTDAILASGGYLDKYVGDSVMAVWGAPYEDARHAWRACLSALEQQRLIHRLNDRIEEEFGVRLQVRMGINSGEMTAGNMGSERKFQYTVIGDAVNLAARIEPINRDAGTCILVGEATHALVGDLLVMRKLGRFVVAGRDQPVALYELVGEPETTDPARVARIRRYEAALARFVKQDWDAAESLLMEVLREAEDGPSRWLLDRVRGYRRHPPPASWNGESLRVEKR